MSLDVSQLGATAMGMMDGLAQKERFGDDAEIRTVAIVVEINDGDTTGVFYRCTDPRIFVQEGLFRAAIRAALAHGAEYDPDG